MKGHELKIGDRITFVHRGKLVTDAIKHVHVGRAHVRIWFEGGADKMLPTNADYDTLPGGTHDTQARNPGQAEDPTLQRLFRQSSRR